jgi:hypothetical protein
MKQETKFKETETAKERRNKLNDFLPLFWNSYQHMYDTRITNIQNRINFLLIIVSFSHIFCITLFVYFENPIILSPIIFQFIALLILLKSFFVKGPNVHWFEVDETLEAIDKNELEIDLFSTLKALENSTYTHMQFMGKIIKNSLILLIFSIYFTILLVCFVLWDNKLLLYLVVSILTLVLLYSYYHFIHPHSNYQEDYENIKEKVKKWIENDTNKFQRN